MKYILGLLLLSFIFIPIAENRVKKINVSLQKTQLEIHRLEERRASLRNIESILKGRGNVLKRVTPFPISDPSLAPIVANDLMKKILKSVNMEGIVETSFPQLSRYFPKQLGIMSTEVRIGFVDYESYLGLLKFMENIQETPFYIEEISVGNYTQGMGIDGKIGVRAKFLFLSGG